MFLEEKRLKHNLDPVDFKATHSASPEFNSWWNEYFSSLKVDSSSVQKKVSEKPTAPASIKKRSKRDEAEVEVTSPDPKRIKVTGEGEAKTPTRVKHTAKRVISKKTSTPAKAAKKTNKDEKKLPPVTRKSKRNQPKPPSPVEEEEEETEKENEEEKEAEEPGNSEVEETKDNEDSVEEEDSSSTGEGEDFAKTLSDQPARKEESSSSSSVQEVQNNDAGKEEQAVVEKPAEESTEKSSEVKVSTQSVIPPDVENQLQNVVASLNPDVVQQTPSTPIMDWRSTLEEILKMNTASSPEEDSTQANLEEDDSAADRILGELRTLALENTLGRITGDVHIHQKIKLLLYELEKEMDISQNKGLVEFKNIFEEGFQCQSAIIFNHKSKDSAKQAVLKVQKTLEDSARLFSDCDKTVAEQQEMIRRADEEIKKWQQVRDESAAVIKELLAGKAETEKQCQEDIKSFKSHRDNLKSLKEQSATLKSTMTQLQKKYTKLTKSPPF